MKCCSINDVPFIRYVSSDGMTPRVIVNTNETLNYVLPYDVPMKWKRTTEDKYNPYTTEGKQICFRSWIDNNATKGDRYTWCLFHNFSHGRQLLWLSVCLSANHSILKRIYSKRKNNAPSRSKSFPFIIEKKVRENSRECHNHKPQPLPDTKRKRKPANPNKHKSNKRTKSTKFSSDFPKRGNRSAKRTENTRTK